ncbi:MAG TPA: type IV pilin N-terminal domain-containing protein [Methanocorpusculum sp.]|nr:type IV pilin N-terminal domain-containing protein [Methanocorpusculum sp.]HJK81021.1 type IV pilin N-terminal domain-containing protein [Methanocorpusculum sp.]
MRKADEGVAPVVAVALLIGLVAVAGAIIGLTMFAALEDAAGTPPDVRFQVSADGQSLYHAGGDALPLKNLVFYDTSTKKNVTAQLIKNGKSAVETSLEEAVWETGDKIQFVDGMLLSVLSIVGLDSRNRPALLYLGADAVALPVGDMVPDEWKEGSGGGDTPKPVPTPTYPDYNTGVQLDKKDQITFVMNNKKYDLLTDDRHVNTSNHQVPLPETVTSGPQVLVVSQDGNSDLNVTVTIYDPYSNNPNDPSKAMTVFGPKSVTADHQKKDGIPIVINIPLKKGYVCHVTIINTHNGSNPEVLYDTAVITFT